MIPTRLSFLEVLKNNSKEHERIFKYGAITLFGVSFQRLLLTNFQLVLSLKRIPVHQEYSRNYYLATLYISLRNDRVWALPFSLAATKGIN